MDIERSVFVVTGGASGLGAATTRYLVERGGSVVIADLKEAEGRTLASELGAAARFVRTDVADEASGRAAVAAAVSAFGGLHGLIGCAGIVHGERVLGKEGPHALASFARTITINLVGMFNMVRLGAEAMAAGAPNADGERGVIVTTASIAAYDGQIGQAAYAASKAAVAGMTLPIARDLARDGRQALVPSALKVVVSVGGGDYLVLAALVVKNLVVHVERGIGIDLQHSLAAPIPQEASRPRIAVARRVIARFVAIKFQANYVGWVTLVKLILQRRVDHIVGRSDDVT